MTYEEAIKVIESNRPISGYTMLCEALDIAKEALEKQIPKKIIETDWIYCPNCKRSLDPVQKEKYCVICGQALDWGETE